MGNDGTGCGYVGGECPMYAGLKRGERSVYGTPDHVYCWVGQALDMADGSGDQVRAEFRKLFGVPAFA